MESPVDSQPPHKDVGALGGSHDLPQAESSGAPLQLSTDDSISQPPPPAAAAAPQPAAPAACTETSPEQESDLDDTERGETGVALMVDSQTRGTIGEETTTASAVKKDILSNQQSSTPALLAAQQEPAAAVTTESNQQTDKTSMKQQQQVIRPPSKKSSVGWSDAQKGSEVRLLSSRKLPQPPSIRRMRPTNDNDNNDKDHDDDPPVAVFNANTPAGASMVRALSKRGQAVVAVVRVFTSKNTKALLQLPNVTVKVADSHDQDSLAEAVRGGVHRAFLVTKYWERFDSWLEESQALVIVRACANVGVPHLVLSSVEDTQTLKERGLTSQVVPDKRGVIHPKFEGMRNLRQDAKAGGVQLTHMLTSYLDQEHSKKSVCIMMSDSGKLLLSEAW